MGIWWNWVRTVELGIGYDHGSQSGPRFRFTSIVLNIDRYTDISAEIQKFYPKRYDKCKNLPNIILDRYWPIYRHVADILADIRDEISDISALIVTYLDNNYYFLLERLFFLFYVHYGISMVF